MSPDTRTHLLQWAWVYGAFPLAWASVLLHLRTPWRRTELGKHLLTYAVLIALILTFSVLRYFYASDLPEPVEWTRWVIYMAFPPVMAWRVSIQLRAANRRHR